MASALLMVSISMSGGSLYAAMCRETNGRYDGSASGSGRECRKRHNTSLVEMTYEFHSMTAPMLSRTKKPAASNSNPPLA